jgi:RNA polymerase sigma-70 factor, ECF subfamily
VDDTRDEDDRRDRAPLAPVGVAMDLDLLKALRRLPPVARAAFILRDRLGWDDTSVAELLDTSTASVDAALRQARSVLCEGGHLNHHR